MPPFPDAAASQRCRLEPWIRDGRRVVLSFGGVAGAILLGMLTIRYRLDRILWISVLSAAAGIVTFAGMLTHTGPAIVFTAAMGSAVNASLRGVAAVTPKAYPVMSRSTETYWLLDGDCAPISGRFRLGMPLTELASQQLQTRGQRMNGPDTS